MDGLSGYPFTKSSKTVSTYPKYSGQVDTSPNLPISLLLFYSKNSVFAGGHTGEYLLHNLHYHPSPGIHMYVKKQLPKVLLHLTENDVKTCFDVKTVSLNEKQTARVFCSEYE